MREGRQESDKGERRCEREDREEVGGGVREEVEDGE